MSANRTIKKHQKNSIRFRFITLIVVVALALAGVVWLLGANLLKASHASVIVKDSQINTRFETMTKARGNFNAYQTMIDQLSDHGKEPYPWRYGRNHVLMSGNIFAEARTHAERDGTTAGGKTGSLQLKDATAPVSTITSTTSAGSGIGSIPQGAQRAAGVAAAVGRPSAPAYIPIAKKARSEFPVRRAETFIPENLPEAESSQADSGANLPAQSGQSDNSGARGGALNNPAQSGRSVHIKDYH